MNKPILDMYANPHTATALAAMKERDRLKALNAELMAAWDGLTIITRHDDGRIVLGPVGWEQACAAFTKARKEG